MKLGKNFHYILLEPFSFVRFGPHYFNKLEKKIET